MEKEWDAGRAGSGGGLVLSGTGGSLLVKDPFKVSIVVWKICTKIKVVTFFAHVPNQDSTLLEKEHKSVKISVQASLI